MLIKSTDTELLVAIVEGTGDNLLEEDIAAGYQDYAMIEVYDLAGTEMRNINGGQLMLDKLYRDYEEEEIIKRAMNLMEIKGDYIKVIE